MKRSQWMKSKHGTLQKVADDAHAKFLEAEDVLADLEAREARRSQRSAAGGSVPPALAARTEGRI